MEITPIKRNKNIVAFSKEHHAALLFCWKLRWGMHLNTENNRITDYVKWFWKNYLQPHQLEEEELLFFNAGDSLVKKAIDDHLIIKSKVEDITTNNSQSLYEALHDLADFLEEHTRYEERILFPHLEKVLTETELEKIGDALDESRHHTANEEYHDEFWKERNAK